MNNYPETVIFRCKPEERAALVAIRRAYGLRSLSEAARRAIQTAAAERNLTPANSGQQRGGAQYEPE